jgi:hypothetical protein
MFNPNTKFDGGDVNEHYNPEDVKQDEHAAKIAQVGTNLTFESDEIRKQREATEQKKMYKIQRKQAIIKENEQILSLIKELKDDMPEEQQKQIKGQITDLKSSMNLKLNEEKEEKQMDIQAKQDKQKTFIAKKKAVAAKKKAIVAKTMPNVSFSLILHITDSSISK